VRAPRIMKNKMAAGRYYFNPLASSKAGAAREITVFLNGTCLMSDEYNKDTHMCVCDEFRSPFFDKLVKSQVL
jgi:hypothetical protein